MKTIKVVFVFGLMQLLSVQMVGQIWQSLNGGASYSVRDMANDENMNTLNVVGQFQFVSDSEITANGFALWDGYDWFTSEAVFPNNCQFGSCDQLNSIEVYNGEVFTSGYYGSIDGFQIHKWDGENWQIIGTSDAPGILSISNDVLFYTGEFSDISGGEINNIATWDGENWIPFASGFPLGTNSSFAIGATEFYNDQLYFGGNFQVGDSLGEIVRWTENEWRRVGAVGIAGDSWVNSMVAFDDLLFVGGYFSSSDGNPSDNLVAWDGSSFINPFPEVQFLSQVRDMTVINNELFVLGSYVLPGECCVYSIGKYDGTQFCTFGGYEEYPDMNTSASKIAGFNDELYIAGTFINGQSIENIAFLPLSTPSDTCLILEEVISLDTRYSSTYPIDIHPNPATDHFYLELQEETNQPQKLEIYTLTGQRVKSASLSGGQRQKVDVSNLGAGMYVVRLTENNLPVSAAKLLIAGR